MDVSGIKTAQLTVSGTTAGDVDETEKSRRINQSEDIFFLKKSLKN